MAISFTRYVDIVSGVGAGAAVAERELIGRLFTTNHLVPPDSFVEMENVEEVGDYFGTASDEYKRAQFYFGWISKNITQAQKISYAAYVDADRAAVIYGTKGSYSLSTFTAVTTGALNMTIGAATHTLTSINLSAAGSLTVVAADVQAAIRAYTVGGVDWTSATVSFDATRGSFNFVGGVPGVEAIAVGTAGTGVDLAPLLGWSQVTAIIGAGSVEQSITDTLANSAAASNNFGSFLFMPTLTTDQITEAATWNGTQNVLYQYMVPVTASNAAAINAAIIDIAGNAMTLAPLAAEYPEMEPMMILAATAYDRRNSVQNYMFQQFALTPSVTNDSDADTYDALRVNYYGETQTAGQFIKFYQRGVLTGLSTNPIDQNTYANEQWLKDAIGSQIMTLLLALAQVPANTQGRAQLLAQIQSVINQAVFNGTISVGKPLTSTQKLFIANATGDENAWHQVQTIGYWVDCVITPYVEDGTTKYKAVYTLIYSKDDIIRKVEGSDILI